MNENEYNQSLDCMGMEEKESVETKPTLPFTSYDEEEPRVEEQTIKEILTVEEATSAKIAPVQKGVTRLDKKVSVPEEKTTGLSIIEKLEKNDKETISKLTKYLAPSGVQIEYFRTAIIRALTTKSETTGKTIMESCDKGSIVEAVTLSACVGVPPGVSAFGNLANFIPRKNKKEDPKPQCKFELAARGIIYLGARNGIIIKSGAALGDDILEYEEGGNGGKGHFKYIQKPYYIIDKKDGEKVQALRTDKGEKYFAWAYIAKYAIIVAVLMTREEINHHRKGSTNLRWGTHYDEMAKKTCVNRLGKVIIPYLPLQTIISEGVDDE